MLQKISDLFISSNSNSYNQFFRFIISGGFASCVAVAIFYFLISFLDINHLISNTISYFVGLIVEYILNKYWVFNAKEVKNVKSISLFLIVSFICLLLSNLVIYVLVDLSVLIKLFHFNNENNLKLVAKIISVLFNSVWDFFAKKIVVFKIKKTYII